MTQLRRLGRSGIQVAPIGVGTWVMGGRFGSGDQPLGWGEVDDAESVRTLHRAFDLGATLVDTSDNYGTGHAEEVLGRAIADRRDRVVVATKWGYTFNSDERETIGTDASPGYLRSAVEASLRRLATDYIDLYQLHLNDVSVQQAVELAGVCDELVTAGRIRAYGWSTDDAEAMDAFAAQTSAAAVQFGCNVLTDAPAMLAVTERRDLGALCRSPLAMGLLSNRITADTVLGADDVRGRSPEWLAWFTDGRPDPDFLRRRDAVRAILTAGGRTVAQGALAWLLARSPSIVPIPGCRTVAQAEENLGTLTRPPLSADDLRQIDELLTSDETSPSDEPDPRPTT
ncbi:MAG: aldo/keto reductase [bacterium]